MQSRADLFITDDSITRTRLGQAALAGLFWLQQALTPAEVAAFLSQQADLTLFAAGALQPVLQLSVLQQSPLQAFSPQHLPSVQQAAFSALAVLQPALQLPTLQQSPLQALFPQHLPSVQQTALAAVLAVQQADFSALAELQPALQVPVLQHSPLQALSPQHLPLVQQLALP